MQLSCRSVVVAEVAAGSVPGDFEADGERRAEIQALGEKNFPRRSSPEVDTEGQKGNVLRSMKPSFSGGAESRFRR
jgi:hypothetical protein